MKGNAVKIWKLFSVVAALAMLLVLIPMNITALDNQAYDDLVDDIFQNMYAQKEEFQVTYGGLLLQQGNLSQAVEEAICTSPSNLFRVGNYHYVQKGRTVDFQVEYQHINDYDIVYAPSEAEAAHILSRVVSQQEAGINLYLYLPDATVDDVKELAQRCYNQMYDYGGDDYSKYCLNRVSYAVTVSATQQGGYFLSYTMQYNETQEQSQRVRTFAQYRVMQLGIESATDEEKVEAINKDLKEMLEYKSTGAITDHTAFGAMTNGTAVCQGYALLADEMLRQAGVTTRVITGTATDPYTGVQDSHMWNAVKIDGEWLHVDITWNDAYPYSNPYLLLTAEEMAKDHSYDSERFSPSQLDAGVEEQQQRRDSLTMLYIGKPRMTVGDSEMSIDPGRTTVPMIQDGRTLLPIRAVVEALGGTVDWDGDNQQIIIHYREYDMALTLDSHVAQVNGLTMRMDVPPVSIDERTMVPLRFVAEMLGMGVVWNGEDQSIALIPN